MIKSLGDYNKEQSSSSDLKNIKWSKKNPNDPEKPKSKKKTKKISPTNIIYSNKTKPKKSFQRVFKVDELEDSDKPKDSPIGKKFQKSSVSNCKIEPGFRRPGR